MNPTLIFTFLAVARTQSVSRAAFELNQTQSTVSKRLKSLEETLGRTLFDRKKGSNGVLLTPDGEEFMALAERWLPLHEELARFQEPARPVELKIAGVDSLNFSFLGEVCLALSRNEPHIHLTIQSYFFQRMYSAVVERRADVGFSFYRAAHPSLHVRLLYSEPMVGLSRGGTSGWRVAPTPLDALRPEREIHTPWADLHEIWRKTHLQPGKAAATVYPLSILIRMLAEPDQWAIVPQSFAVYALNQGDFHIFDLDPAPPRRVCYLLTHKHAAANVAGATAVFERYLMETLDTLFGKNRDGDSALIRDLKEKLRRD